MLLSFQMMDNNIVYQEDMLKKGKKRATEGIFFAQECKIFELCLFFFHL